MMLGVPGTLHCLRATSGSRIDCPTSDGMPKGGIHSRRQCTGAGVDRQACVSPLPVRNLVRVHHFDLVIVDCDGVQVDSERLAVRTETQILSDPWVVAHGS